MVLIREPLSGELVADLVPLLWLCASLFFSSSNSSSNCENQQYHEASTYMSSLEPRPYTPKFYLAALEKNQEVRVRCKAWVRG